MTPDANQTWGAPSPYDFFETTRLLRTGHRDPTVRREPDGLWRTARTDAGPATVWIKAPAAADGRIEANAWGPGAERALADVPRWLGLEEERWTLPISHPVTDRLLVEHQGLRSADTRDVFEAMVNLVLQQLVTWNEAAMTWRRLCEGLGEAAPGPEALLLTPTPRAIRDAGVPRLQSFGIGRQRAVTLLEVARVAHRLQQVVDMPTAEAAALLQKIRGIGPWTAAMVLGLRFGRPDPLPLGDFHMPNTIAWALAREPRATEERMMELLAPFDGFAFRVVRLVFAARIQAPKRGPKRGWGHRS